MLELLREYALIDATVFALSQLWGHDTFRRFLLVSGFRTRSTGQPVRYAGAVMP